MMVLEKLFRFIDCSVQDDGIKEEEGLKEPRRTG